MRNRFEYYIHNKKEFIEKLVFWTKKHEHSCVLNSNKSNQCMPQHYKDYDFLCAIGAEKICVGKNKSFEKLKTFYNQNKDWMFGYFSYDLKNETDLLTSKNVDFLGFPKLYFFIPEIVMYLNAEKLFVETFATKKQIDNIISEIDQQHSDQDFFGNLEMQKRESKQQYLRKVEKIKITDGGSQYTHTPTIKIVNTDPTSYCKLCCSV